jgi:hypothetical protein
MRFFLAFIANANEGSDKYQFVTQSLLVTSSKHPKNYNMILNCEAFGCKEKKSYIS